MIGNAKLARPGLAVDVINDNRHVLPDSPHARESSPHLIHLPDEGIASFTYTWVNKAGEAGAAYAIFGPGVGDPLELRIPDRPVPADMDWSNWTVGDYTLKQDLQFTHSDTLWRSDAATIEFSFDAFHPPYAYGANKDGCPSYTAVNRIEQSGHVKGKFVIGDRTVPFDTVGHRDHSWGTRDWGAFQHYQWFQGQSEDGVSVHFWRFWALGQVNLRGYVFKDGLLAEITDVQTDIKFDDALWQQSMTATIIDEAGRTTKVTTEFYAHYTLKADPTLHLREGASRATFDGSPALGWLEVAWPPAYLDYVAANGPY
jgi:hypothetical protein